MDIFALGLGYCALRLLRSHPRLAVAGTVRSREAANNLIESGIEAFVFDGRTHEIDPATLASCGAARTILASAPPQESGDPFLPFFADNLKSSPNIKRIIYLSTVGVYGDWRGDWVDETSPLLATSPRGRQRIRAEAQWQAFGERAGVAVDILRLAGIYGPGRNILVKLRDGSARRLVKPGQVFNRIHVDDIARVIVKLNERDGAGEIWNVADEEPSPPQDVVSHGARLLGCPLPPVEAIEEAAMSEMSATFYAENKRVSVEKLRNRLGIRLLYPTYREGLRALFESGEGR